MKHYSAILLFINLKKKTNKRNTSYIIDVGVKKYTHLQIFEDHPK